MRIIVFGATGTVGKQVVQQALYKGFDVRAFGRNVYTTDFLEPEKLELVQGALFDEKEVYHAINGCDAVVSAIGGSFDGTDKARTLGMKNIIKQMTKAGVKRIVAIGNMAVLNADEETMLIDTESYPVEYIPVGREHQKAFNLLNESTLDWTFVCPPDIINYGPTGIFNTAANYPPTPNQYKINSGDLSLFMLNELVKNEFVKQRVGISN